MPIPGGHDHVCSTCSALIPDVDLESGAAIALLGKKYCATCKGHAVKDVSLDDLMEGSPAAPSPAKAPAAAKPAPKAAPRPAAAAPRTPVSGRPASSGRNRLKPVRRSSSKGPLIALVVILAVAALLAVVVINVSSGGPKPRPNPGAGTSTPTPEVPPETADSKAQLEFLKVETLSRRSDMSLDLILAAIEKAAPVCKGTPYEAKLEELRNNTIKQKEFVGAQEALQGLVDKIRLEVQADKDFRRYGELMEKLRSARQTASKGAPKKLAELQKIQSEYSSRYENAAKPFFDEINNAAQVLSREGRYDDALAQINRFPVHLRHSGAWNGLMRLKKGIEASRRRKRRP